jgi:hypothetical protein
LLSDANDISGNYGPMTLTNTPFTSGGIYCNGIYKYSGLSGFCDGYTPVINMDINSLTIAVDFMITQNIEQSVFTCGTSGRWLGLALSNNGSIGITYNNSNTSYSGTKCSLNQWHNAKICYDGSTITLYLDDNPVCSQNITLDYSAPDAIIGITNWATGKVFKGYLRNLKILKEVQGPVTGIGNEREGIIKVYPIPAKDYIILNLSDYSDWEKSSVKVTNQVGQTIYRTQIYQPVFTVSTSSWNGKGLYILEIFDRNNIRKVIKKVVVE